MIRDQTPEFIYSIFFIMQHAKVVVPKHIGIRCGRVGMTHDGEKESGSNEDE